MQSPLPLRLSTLIAIVLVFVPSATGGEQPYSIRTYELVIHPDFRARTLALDATLVIENPRLGDRFSFGLNDAYSSVTVTADETPVAVQRGDGEILIKLEKPTATVTLHCSLRGVPGKSADVGRDVIADSSLFLLWSDRFYPIDFDHWSIVKTTVVLPAAFKVFAPGMLVETRTRGEFVEHVFQTTRPAVSFSVFADSRWIDSSAIVNGIPMQTLLLPGSQKFARQIVVTSAEILKFYSDTYGTYPFDRFAFLSIDGLDARRAFSGAVGYSPAYLEREMTTTGYDAHETALLWWGYTLRGDGAGSFQWTEGFGDYAEILYAEKYGKTLARIFERFRNEYLALPSSEDLLYSELRGNTPQEEIHGKYPWLMHVLRYVVGDSGFQSAVKLLFSRYSYRTFTMDEFVSTLGEGCGQSLVWWRNEWLGRKGVPNLRLITSTAETRDGFRSTLRVEQTGEVYHLPVEVGVETSGGTETITVALDGRESESVHVFKDKPKAFHLDPNGWVLMRVIPP